MNIGELVTVKTIENKNAFDEKHTPYSAINTICNYDADIIPYLNAEYGSAFVRIDNKTFAIDDGSREIFVVKNDKK